jgi:hypothetical protein
MPAVYRVIAGLVTAVLVGMAAAAILYQTSVQPGAAIAKAVFQQGQLVTPPAGFATIARTVTEQRVSVSVPGAPTAYLDIYTPDGAATKPRPVILWVHGGGFISSSAATVADYTILLAHAGYTVASLDYSLAPGTRYPAPVRPRGLDTGGRRNGRLGIRGRLGRLRRSSRLVRCAVDAALPPVPAGRRSLPSNRGRDDRGRRARHRGARPRSRQLTPLPTRPPGPQGRGQVSQAEAPVTMYWSRRVKHLPGSPLGLG